MRIKMVNFEIVTVRYPPLRPDDRDLHAARATRWKKRRVIRALGRRSPRACGAHAARCIVHPYQRRRYVAYVQVRRVRVTGLNRACELRRGRTGQRGMGSDGRRELAGKGIARPAVAVTR